MMMQLQALMVYPNLTMYEKIVRGLIPNVSDIRKKKTDSKLQCIVIRKAVRSNEIDKINEARVAKSKNKVGTRQMRKRIQHMIAHYDYIRHV